MAIFDNILDTIGNTPLVRLHHIEEEYKLDAKLFAKVEYFNPGGSIKDRPAMMMIKDAFESKRINKETKIIEPTSGNTGIGLALICSYLKLDLTIIMPDTMSKERQLLIKAYGANLILTEGKLGMKGAIEKANELAKQYPNSFIPSQFDNPSNVKAHYLTTAKEIAKDLDNKVDIFVAGVGTGGTLTGCASYFRDNKINTTIVAVEPSGSPVLSKNQAGPHKIQGIGAGFVPLNLDTKLIDEIIDIDNEEAFDTTNMVAKLEGLLVGISSGAALNAAIKVAKRSENKNKNIVVVFPDTGSRYLSCNVFE